MKLSLDILDEIFRLCQLTLCNLDVSGHIKAMKYLYEKYGVTYVTHVVKRITPMFLAALSEEDKQRLFYKIEF